MPVAHSDELLQGFDSILAFWNTGKHIVRQRTVLAAVTTLVTIWVAREVVGDHSFTLTDRTIPSHGRICDGLGSPYQRLTRLGPVDHINTLQTDRNKLRKCSSLRCKRSRKRSHRCFDKGRQRFQYLCRIYSGIVQAELDTTGQSYRCCYKHQRRGQSSVWHLRLRSECISSFHPHGSVIGTHAINNKCARRGLEHSKIFLDVVYWMYGPFVETPTENFLLFSII